MAKYVGKVVQLPNSILKLQGSGTHYVHVKWFDPKSKLFHCKVITSLEERVVFSKGKKKMGKSPYFREKGSPVVNVFLRGKYEEVRKGLIDPIPIGKTSGFDGWVGYFESRQLTLHTLRKARLKTKRTVEK